jgi:hypothetical protein
MIKYAIMLMLLSTVAFGLTPLEGAVPDGVPADAEIEEDENLVEAPIVKDKSADLRLTRIIPKKAYAGEEFTVTLRVENKDDGLIEMLLIEPMRQAVTYVNAPEPSIIRYEALEVRLLRWSKTLDPGETVEYDYVMRSDSPGSVTFPPATVNDQYGNTFESKPMYVMVECVPDGVCNPGENYINCPADCTTGIKDGVCDGVVDGRIDPDCIPEADPDYVPEAPVEGPEDEVWCNALILPLLALALALVRNPLL